MMWKMTGFLAALFVLSGCSTPQKRSRNYPEMMEALTPEEREMVEAGEVEVGFSEEMVLVALGEPDRRFTQRSASGEREIWVYYAARRPPGVSLGVGAGMTRGRSSGYGGGVSVGTGSRSRLEERYRLVFENERVAEIARTNE